MADLLDPHVLFCETEFKIDFFEVDSMRIAWHGNYINYFEKTPWFTKDVIGSLDEGFRKIVNQNVAGLKNFAIPCALWICLEELM